MSEPKKDAKGRPAGDKPERRGAPRVQLDRQCFARLYIEGLESYNVMLTDISPQGAQLLLPPQITPEQIPEGVKLFLYNFPEEFGPLRDREVEGELAWRGLRNCGMVFSVELEVSVEDFIVFSAKI